MPDFRSMTVNDLLILTDKLIKHPEGKTKIPGHQGRVSSFQTGAENQLAVVSGFSPSFGFSSLGLTLDTTFTPLSRSIAALSCRSLVLSSGT